MIVMLLGAIMSSYVAKQHIILLIANPRILVVPTIEKLELMMI